MFIEANVSPVWSSWIPNCFAEPQDNSQNQLEDRLLGDFGVDGRIT